ncbi:hypothetical protein EBZ39_05685 [bacterium]|nr:hypothetical protein [bacterium]
MCVREILGSVKIPSRVRIKKGIHYEIVFQDVIRNDPDCLGFCDGDARIIYLKTGQSEKELLKSLIHEILHSLTFEYSNLKISHSAIYELEDPILRLLILNKWIT